MDQNFHKWLHHNELDVLGETFRQHDIDFKNISSLTDGELAAIGLTLGQRRKLQLALNQAIAPDRTSRLAVANQPKTLSPAFQVDSAERRQMTVMLCDMVGSTKLSNDFDPETVRDILIEYRQTVAAEVNKYNGFTARFIGDGILVYFGYPTSNEHQVELAVRAALAITAALDKQRNPRMEVRIGIATGTVVVGAIEGGEFPEEHAVVGSAPNLAARLTAVAAPRSVVICDSTLDLLNGLFLCRDLGLKKLKGFPDRVQCWEILKESNLESRSHSIHTKSDLTPFTGREEELKQLHEQWHRAIAGAGRAILLAGEAGIGKSRLVRCFHDKIRAENPDLMTRQVFCSQIHHNTPLHPIASMLEKDCGLNHLSTTEQKRVRIKEFIFDRFGDQEHKYRLMCDMLSVHDAGHQPIHVHKTNQRMAESFDFLTEYISVVTAHGRPMMFLIEDVHWADPTTLEFIGCLLDGLSNSAPCLVIMTSRAGSAAVERIRLEVPVIKLERLSERQSLALLQSINADQAVSVDVLRIIIQKSDHIPLFLEEVFRAVAERQLRETTEQSRSDRLLSYAPEVPSTLQDTLLERLDRLGPAKLIAQIAACLRIRFTSDFLADVSKIGQTTLEAQLDDLVRRHILIKSQTDAETSYTFRHALLQDAAASTMLLRDRRALHRTIATTYERRYPNMVRREAEVLAFHYTQASMPQKAADFWLRAGQYAFEQSANKEAIEHYNRGLQVIRDMLDDKSRTDREAALRTSLARSYYALKGGRAKEVEQNYWRARQLSGGENSSSHCLDVLIGCWIYYFVTAQLREATNLSDEIIDITSHYRADYNADACRIRGLTMFFVGKFKESQSSTEESIEEYDHDTLRQSISQFGLDSLVCCHAYLGNALVFQGRIDEGISSCQLAMKRAVDLDHPYSMTFSYSLAALLHQAINNERSARVLSQSAIQLAERHEFQFWMEQQSVLNDWCRFERSPVQENLQQLEHSMQKHLQDKPVLESTRFLALTADANRKIGNTERSRELINQAILTSAQTHELFYLPEVYRIKAELELSHGEPQSFDLGYEDLRCSLDIAEKQQALLWLAKTCRTIASLPVPLARRGEKVRKLCGVLDREQSGSNMKEATRIARELLSETRR